MVGVNGVGKTTTIGKLASRFAGDGKKVMVAAGDTFRAAAADQLKIWSERSGAAYFAGKPQQDPASVLFEACSQGKAQNIDVVLCDTAGRLHTKTGLMDELKKAKRVLGKVADGAPHEVWLVVDATTGQNAVTQAREFHEAVGLTGIVLTKLDGTAKGGVVVAIAAEMQIPIRFVGVGETAADLAPVLFGCVRGGVVRAIVSVGKKRRLGYHKTMLGGLALSICLCGLQLDGEARTPPALEHFIRAQILLDRGEHSSAEAELRYALSVRSRFPFYAKRSRASCSER